MPKYFNYIIFTLLIAVLVISFAITYKGGDEIIVDQSEFKNENILINVYHNTEKDKVNLQMASINPGYKIEVSFDSTKESTFTPGYSTFELDNTNFEMRTYRKWLQIIWLPYNSVEINLNKEDLKEMNKDGTIKFKAEFAERLMEYYRKNQ